MNPLSIDLIQGFKLVLGEQGSSFALHEPEFTGREKEYINECIDSTYVSSVGAYVDKFESMLADNTGSRYVIAVVNGTSALQIAFHIAGIKKDQEVIIPALSFVATANAVALLGAVPHFVDSNEDTLGMDPSFLRDYLEDIAEITSQGARNRFTGRKIAAITPMHTYGHPVDMYALVELAAKYRIPVIEDSAESLGSYYHGKHTGTFGELGILSFNGNKIITTGGGGAILTENANLAKIARHVTTTAKIPHKWEFFHDEVAWNYRMPNLNAALGCAQLDRLSDMVLRKRKLAEKYQKAFSAAKNIKFISEPENCVSNYWLNTVRLMDASRSIRDEVLSAVNDNGYQCRPTWTLLNKLPMYKSCPCSSLQTSEKLESTLLNIPSSPKLADLL